MHHYYRLMYFYFINYEYQLTVSQFYKLYFINTAIILLITLINFLPQKLVSACVSLRAFEITSFCWKAVGVLKRAKFYFRN